jgi:hypothetical protein
MGWTCGESQFEIRRYFSSRESPEQHWSTPRPFLRVVKRTDRESNHSPPYSVNVKNTRSYSSNSPYIFTACAYLRVGVILPLRAEHFSSEYSLLFSGYSFMELKDSLSYSLVQILCQLNPVYISKSYSSAKAKFPHAASKKRNVGFM